MLMNYQLFRIFRRSIVHHNQPRKVWFRAMPLLQFGLCAAMPLFLSDNPGCCRHHLLIALHYYLSHLFNCLVSVNCPGC